MSSPYTEAEIQSFIDNRLYIIGDEYQSQGPSIRAKYADEISRMPPSQQVLLIQSDTTLITGNQDAISDFVDNNIVNPSMGEVDGRTLGITPGTFSIKEGSDTFPQGKTVREAVIWAHDIDPSQNLGRDSSSVFRHEIGHQLDNFSGEMYRDWSVESDVWKNALEKDLELNNRPNVDLAYSGQVNLANHIQAGAYSGDELAREAMATVKDDYAALYGIHDGDLKAVDVDMSRQHPNLWEAYKTEYLPVEHERANHLLQADGRPRTRFENPPLTQTLATSAAEPNALISKADYVDARMEFEANLRDASGTRPLSEAGLEQQRARYEDNYDKVARNNPDNLVKNMEVFQTEPDTIRTLAQNGLSDEMRKLNGNNISEAAVLRDLVREHVETPSLETARIEVSNESGPDANGIEGRTKEVGFETERSPTIPNAQGDFTSAIADGAPTRSMFGKVLDAGATALKIGGRALPVVGGVVAGAEVLGLSSEAHAAHANGDITTTEFATLEGIYGAHIAQGTVDPTGFGGEIAIQKAYGELSKGWSPELQELLRPSSLGDMFEKSEKSAEQTQFEQVIEGLEGADIKLSPEAQKLSDLYNDVVEAEQNYEAAKQQMGTLGGSQIQETMQAEAQMEEAYEAYEEHYNDLEKSGKIDAITAELEGDFTGPDADQAGNLDQLRQAQAHGLGNNVPANTAEAPTVSTPSHAQDFST